MACWRDMNAPDALPWQPSSHSALHCGDCLHILRAWPAQCVDLIVTSPPYADQRSSSYGGVKPDDYVAWFLPRAEQFLRVLKS